MWQFGLVDTFTAVHLMYNAGAQYSSIVVAALIDGNITKLPTIIFEPIAGLGVGYQFVKAAQTAAERRARVATLAALLSASATTAATPYSTYQGPFTGLESTSQTTFHFPIPSIKILDSFLTILL